MRRVLKWGAILLGAVALAVGGFLLYVAVTGIPTYDVQHVEMNVVATADRMERGQKLATTLCQACHFDPTTGGLTGSHIPDLPEEFGVAYSKNITSDRSYGIGSWKDGEIAWLLRTGVHPKTGTYVMPWMPKFPHMSDEDIKSIIVFLRSDDPLVAPQAVKNRESSPSFFATFLSHVAFTALPYPTKPINAPDTNNLVAYGEYAAAGVFDCYSCHSSDFATVDIMTPSASDGYMGGGTQMPDINGKLITTANITFDEATGIGKWSQEQFTDAVRNGFHASGRPLRYPMIRYSQLSDLECRAMYAYLKTIPKITHAVSAAETYADANDGTPGRRAYYKYECVRCHGIAGKGIADITIAHAKYPDDSVLVDVISNITSYYPKSIMPAWSGRMSSQEIIDVAGYVRTLAAK